MENLTQSGYDDLNELFIENKEIFSNINSNHFNNKKIVDVANSILNNLNIGNKVANHSINTTTTQQGNFNIFDNEPLQNKNSVNLLVRKKLIYRTI